MRIAFMGIRGIPKGYSGFETFVRELAPRLVARGHDVTVYGRSYHQQSGRYKGVRLVSLPTVRRKHAETIAHTALSALHGLRKGYDIVYICIVGNAPMAVVPRLGGAKVVLNVDGADCERGKWGGWAQRYLRWTEWVACRVANVIIADARAIQKRYREIHATETTYIPYGANCDHDDRTDALDHLGIQPREYVLFVGRMVPENAAELLIEAYKGVHTTKRLVIVGDAPYAEAYKSKLRAMAGADVLFAGGVFGDGYRQLSSHAYLFVLPSPVDGTRPVLLDQLGFGNCVLARGTPANAEVVGECGVTFDPDRPLEDLTKRLQYLLDHPDVVSRFRRRATPRIRERYSWDSVTQQYETLFEGMLRGEK